MLKLFDFFVQRKGAKEQLDQSQIDAGVLVNNDIVEDDIVVDAMEVERDVKPYTKDFMVPGAKIISLEQAVLHSIERCRKYHLDSLVNAIVHCVLI